MGERGQRVRDLQARLNAMGAHLKLDGEFGPATLAAVRELQKKYGLKTDGLVGPKTTAALRGQMEGRRKQKNLRNISRARQKQSATKTSAAERRRQKAESYQEGKPSTAAPAAYGHG